MRRLEARERKTIATRNDSHLRKAKDASAKEVGHGDGVRDGATHGPNHDLVGRLAEKVARIRYVLVDAAHGSHLDLVPEHGRGIDIDIDINIGIGIGIGHGRCLDLGHDVDLGLLGDDGI